jgi:hypothetical protein
VPQAAYVPDGTYHEVCSLRESLDLQGKELERLRAFAAGEQHRTDYKTAKDMRARIETLEEELAIATDESLRGNVFVPATRRRVGKVGLLGGEADSASSSGKDGD